MNKSIEVLEAENELYRRQIDEFSGKIHLLSEMIYENEYEIEKQLHAMEHEYEGSEGCTLCLGECNTPGAANDGTN